MCACKNSIHCMTYQIVKCAKQIFERLLLPHSVIIKLPWSGVVYVLDISLTNFLIRTK